MRREVCMEMVGKFLFVAFIAMVMFAILSPSFDRLQLKWQRWRKSKIKIGDRVRVLTIMGPAEGIVENVGDDWLEFRTNIAPAGLDFRVPDTVLSCHRDAAVLLKRA